MVESTCSTAFGLVKVQHRCSVVSWGTRLSLSRLMAAGHGWDPTAPVKQAGIRQCADKQRLNSIPQQWDRHVQGGGLKGSFLGKFAALPKKGGRIAACSVAYLRGLSTA